MVETGSAWVTGITDVSAGNQIHLPRLTAVEVVAAIIRRQRGGGISAADGALLLATFRWELANQFQIEEVPAALYDQAMVLAERHGLRGADALQLAVTLNLNTQFAAQNAVMTLVCADDELNNAARAEGLTVENPNDHP